MSVVERSDSEITDLHNEAVVRANEPTRYGGLSYEQGVADTLEWLTNQDFETPLE